MTEHFIIENGHLIQYCGPKEIIELVIPEGIVSFDSFVFRRLQNHVQRIVMPSSLTEIRGSAFESFHRLEKVGLSANLKSIPERCFCNCNRLSVITNAEGLVSIGNRAFQKTNLQRISLPKIETLGTSAFEGCAALETVELSAKVKSIPHCCFAFCRSLKNLKLCDGLERIMAEAFRGTPIPQLEIPASVYKIEEKSRNNNSTFEPDTVITISPDNMYYYMEDGKICQHPYHEEGGLYTVTPECDKADRGKLVRDVPEGAPYYLRKICYSREMVDGFVATCNSYCFQVQERTMEGNDDLNIEKMIDSREYTETIPIDCAVIKDNRIIGFLCADRLLKVDIPGASVSEDGAYNRMSYDHYEYCKRTYSLASVMKD